MPREGSYAKPSTVGGVSFDPLYRKQRAKSRAGRSREVALYLSLVGVRTQAGTGIKFWQLLWPGATAQLLKKHSQTLLIWTHNYMCDQIITMTTLGGVLGIVWLERYLRLRELYPGACYVRLGPRLICTQIRLMYLANKEITKIYTEQLPRSSCARGGRRSWTTS